MGGENSKYLLSSSHPFPHPAKLFINNQKPDSSWGDHIPWVSFSENERIIGYPALTQSLHNPQNTLFNIKQIIGRKYFPFHSHIFELPHIFHRFSDPVLQGLMKQWPFKVVSQGNDKPFFQVNFQGKEQFFSPEEIYAMILARLKRSAETFLGYYVSNAVVAVPVYFNVAQCQAIMDAGTITGLNIIRLIPEPIAATYAYLNECSKANMMPGKELLIYDLGSTCNVALVSLANGVAEIRAVAGSMTLGGREFDTRLVEDFVLEYKRKFGKDITSSYRAMTRLRRACERARRRLSTISFVTIEIDALFEGIDFYTDLTRV